jgi:hypothetical protein
MHSSGETTATDTATEALTMLEALTRYSEEQVLERLADGRITLTGNFRGQEQQIVQSY